MGSLLLSQPDKVARLILRCGGPGHRGISVAEPRDLGYNLVPGRRIPIERFGARLLGQLLDVIRDLVREGRYVVGEHAAERFEERGILEWQAVAGLEDGTLIAERSDATPNPAVEVRESLPDGTEFKAVWSLLPRSGVAKLVTVHFFERR